MLGFIYIQALNKRNELLRELDSLEKLSIKKENISKNL